MRRCNAFAVNRPRCLLAVDEWRRWVIVLTVGVVVLAGRPGAALAQVGWVVAGRVVDSESGAGLRNARVTLDGHGAVLSSDGGVFHFDRVRSGDYPFRVEALGYKDFSATVEVNHDTVFVARLDFLPIELEGLSVNLGTLDFDGRVRDPRTDSYVFDVDVRSDQGHSEFTSLGGRFDLDDVFDGPPLRLILSGFRYLPLDTTFIPDGEERYPFDLAPDPVMTRMIDTYVTRLDIRAGKRIYEYRPALNREDLARFPVNLSLRAALERRCFPHIVRRIGCLILDEREYTFHSEAERVSVLKGAFANELERIELLEFPGEGRLFMARVYTRRFFQREVGTSGELDTPSMIATPGGGMLCR